MVRTQAEAEPLYLKWLSCVWCSLFLVGCCYCSASSPVVLFAGVRSGKVLMQACGAPGCWRRGRGRWEMGTAGARRRPLSSVVLPSPSRQGTWVFSGRSTVCQSFSNFKALHPHLGICWWWARCLRRGWSSQNPLRFVSRTPRVCLHLLAVPTLAHLLWALASWAPEWRIPILCLMAKSISWRL